MCGRFASFADAQDLADAFVLDPLLVDDVAAVTPSWNVAPTQDLRMVVERLAPADGADGQDRCTAHRSLRRARWGLVPPWATDPSAGPTMINARVETLAEKAAFRDALANRRCLVPADGYYEWRAEAGRRVPYLLAAADGGLLAFAGLYEFWRDPSRAADDPSRWLVTAAIVTTAARAELAHIHDREPVMLPPGAWADWLDPCLTDPATALAVASSAPPPVTARPVNPAVNRVGTDGPRLLDPPSQEQSALFPEQSFAMTVMSDD